MSSCCNRLKFLLSISGSHRVSSCPNSLNANAIGNRCEIKNLGIFTTNNIIKCYLERVLRYHFAVKEIPALKENSGS